jgi:hypothetical protein
MSQSCYNCGHFWNEANRLVNKELSILKDRCKGCHIMTPHELWYPRHTIAEIDPEMLIDGQESSIGGYNGINDR